MGKKAPALTVASLAMTMTSRPATRPTPVTTPAEGAAPVAIHIPRGPQTEFKEVGAGIDQMDDALARGEPALGVLTFNRFGPASLAYRLFFASELFDFMSHFIGHYFAPRRIRSAVSSSYAGEISFLARPS